MRSPLLWLALTLHVALASAYAWCTPHFEGPDENSHYEYAWHLANARALPLTASVQTARGLPQTEAAVLAHHPPLYYALLAAGHVDLVLEDGLATHDIMGVVEVVRAAGGIVTDKTGAPVSMAGTGSLLAAGTPELHAAALEMIG